MEKQPAVDLVNLVCGPQLGRGAYRTVFECRLNPAWVIKHDTRDNHSNIFEFSLWRELEGTPLGKWLAPVEWLSNDGFWLIQRKTEPIRASELPDKIPALFCDMKVSNWGMLDGRPVCHDYGNSRLFALARSHGGRLAKTNWLED